MTELTAAQRIQAAIVTTLNDGSTGRAPTYDDLAAAVCEALAHCAHRAGRGLFRNELLAIADELTAKPTSEEN